MDYFYTPPALVSPTSLVIEGDEFSHLSHVMRKKPGDTICVVDGRGMAYEVVIAEVGAKKARCSVIAQHPLEHEPQRNMTIGVGLLKNGANFDYLVEKTVEIGVATIVPLLTERTIPRHTKTDRWQKIALAAMKQSGRCCLPEVKPLTTLADFLALTESFELKYISHEKVETPLLRNAPAAQTSAVSLCVGPEGGFSEGEIVMALGKGYTPVSLGQRRLRTETAAIVAATLVLL